ncbi:MAG: hypothetical protein Q9172_001319 [Xanthocarpia lactea]
MAKLSLLSLYLEAFRPNQKLRYAIYFGIVFVTLFYTGTFIAFCVLAIPRPGQTLIGTILSDDVASLIPISVAQAGVNVASDFYIFILPIPGVVQLQMPMKKKIGICAIFATGSLACLASIMGLYYRSRLNRHGDVTWDLVDILIWVVVELHVGVMCGCMPAFAGFFNYYLPILRSFGSFFSSRVKGFKLSSRPSSSESSSKRLATKDIHMTLGSRVDGQGHFLNPTSVFAREEDWLRLGEAAHDPPSLARKPSGTRREWHEGMAELKRQSLSSHPPMVITKPAAQMLTRSLTIHDEETAMTIHGIPSGDNHESNNPHDRKHQRRLCRRVFRTMAMTHRLRKVILYGRRRDGRQSSVMKTYLLPLRSLEQTATEEVSGVQYDQYVATSDQSPVITTIASEQIGKT